MSIEKIEIGSYLYFNDWVDGNGPDWCKVLEVNGQDCKIKLEDSGKIVTVKANQLIVDPGSDIVAFYEGIEEYKDLHPDRPIEM